MTSVLLIDDNEEFSRLMQLGLGRMGHEVTIASDGDEGVRTLRRKPFDIVVTDIIMPGKEGLETIIEIRRFSPDTPIIAISGGGVSGKAGFLDVAKKLGANDALEKPFSISHLNDVIRLHTHREPKVAGKKRKTKS